MGHNYAEFVWLFYMLLFHSLSAIDCIFAKLDVYFSKFEICKTNNQTKKTFFFVADSLQIRWEKRMKTF